MSFILDKSTIFLSNTKDKMKLFLSFIFDTFYFPHCAAFWHSSLLFLQSKHIIKSCNMMMKQKTAHILFVFKSIYVLLQSKEAFRFVLCLGNRQLTNDNKDKQKRSRSIIVYRYNYRAWAVVYLLSRVFGDTTKQDKRMVSRFFLWYGFE